MFRLGDGTKFGQKPTDQDDETSSQAVQEYETQQIGNLKSELRQYASSMMQKLDLKQ